MIGLSEIRKQYPEQLQGFDRFMLREYLQHQLLQIIYAHPLFGTRLCFMGGTCLRIVHGNQRFSEDLDFDNLGLSVADWDGLPSLLEKELLLEGYQVTIHNVVKGAFHCHIRFPGLLHATGLSTHKEERILIQLDTEPQHFDYMPQRFLLNRFDVFTEILTTPLNLLLAQKFYAILNRKRAKGRDFFDVIFLLARETQPDYTYLQAKVGISTPQELLHALELRLQSEVMEEVAADVRPFLFQPRDEQKIIQFLPYMRQVLRGGV